MLKSTTANYNNFYNKFNNHRDKNHVEQSLFAAAVSG